MTQAFHPSVNGVIYADLADADRAAGGLATWATLADAEDTALRPTAHTWGRTAAATIDVSIAIYESGDYTLLLRGDAGGAVGWVWVDVDTRRDIAGPAALGRLRLSSAGFAWSDGDAAGPITLGAGIHTIRLTSISSALRLSRLALVPTGVTDVEDGDSARGEGQVVLGDAPTVGTATYVDWLFDESRDPYRALLVALEYDGGTLLAGSAAYLSEYGEAYDDTLLGEPSIETSAGSARDLGDIDLMLVEEETRDPAKLRWRGYPARLLYGDLSWSIGAFRTLATPTIEQCRPEGGRRYRFNLQGAEKRYERAVVTSETTRSESVAEAFAWVLGTFPGASPLGYVNVDPEQLDIAVSYTLDESDVMGDVLATLARSIGALLRVSHTGELEVVRADLDAPASLELDEESIVRGSIRAQDGIAATRRVAVLYGDGLRVEDETGAATGALDETTEIVTYLAAASDAAALLAEALLDYSDERTRYALEVRGLADLLQVGDVVTISHEELTGVGPVTRIRHSALSNASVIEVLI